MSLLENIKKDSLAARKNAIGKEKDTTEAIHSKSLTLLISNINSEMKNRKVDELPDADVIVAVKKSIKTVEDALSKGAAGDYETALRIEKDLLEQYVPPQLTEGEISVWIDNYASEHQIVVSAKDTKAIMQGLNEQYPGSVDGKMVSNIIKSRA